MRAVDVERAAQPAKPMTDVKEDANAVAQGERARGRTDREAFRAALQDAWMRSASGVQEAVYDFRHSR